MRPSSLDPHRPLLIALSAFAVTLATAACGDGASERPLTTAGPPSAELARDLVIGGEDEDDPRYQFAAISSLLDTGDGVLWVADGGGSGGPPRVRQFDASGTYLRDVGGMGEGPGEFRLPQGLARLADGRVALRDAGAPGRITVYEPEGSLDAVWTLGADFGWPQGGADPIQVDEQGRVWLPVVGRGRPGPDRPPPFFVRVSPDGTVLDSVPFPVVPEVDAEAPSITRTTPHGGIVRRGVDVPYLPRGIWAWSPSGHFATARTDAYRIDPAPGAAAPHRPVAGPFHRDVPGVPIDPAERDAIQERIRGDLARMDGGGGLRVPDVPRTKPPLESFWFGPDGSLVVHVSTRSVLQDGEWTEPPAFDVFDREARFLGRLHPEGSTVVSDQLTRVHDGHLWTVERTGHDVEVVVRYSIEWPTVEGPPASGSPPPPPSRDGP